jgi:charged multivesicular body protein 2A
LLREYKRAIDRSCRDLDRERAKLQQQEKKTISEIKKLAAQGQMVIESFVTIAHRSQTIKKKHDFKQQFFFSQAAVQVMAKDLVRTRNYVNKFYKLRSTLQAVSLRLQVCL